MWIWHDIFSNITKKDPLSEFTLKIIKDGNLHEKDYISTLQAVEVKEIDPVRGAEETLVLMKEGKSLIYQGEVPGVKPAILQ